MERKYFVTVTVAVTGDYDPDEARDLIEDACNRIPAVSELVDSSVEQETPLGDLTETPEEAFEFIEADDPVRH